MSRRKEKRRTRRQRLVMMRAADTVRRLTEPSPESKPRIVMTVVDKATPALQKAVEQFASASDFAVIPAGTCIELTPAQEEQVEKALHGASLGFSVSSSVRAVCPDPPEVEVKILKSREGKGVGDFVFGWDMVEVPPPYRARERTTRGMLDRLRGRP